jgi:glycosyltransferase involved in cell wall biosynthesis
LNQTEIVRAYVAADCLVLPSDAGETWGLVVNEAMACGCPALVSDLAGCVYDLVEPGITGDIFRFGDWQGLTNLLVRYGNERQQLAEMGSEAQKKIRDYSPAAAAEGIVRAVSSVLSCRQGWAA